MEKLRRLPTPRDSGPRLHGQRRGGRIDPVAQDAHVRHVEALGEALGAHGLAVAAHLGRRCSLVAF